MNMKTQVKIEEQQFNEDADHILSGVRHEMAYIKSGEPVRLEHGRYVNIGGPIGLDLDEDGELTRRWWKVVRKLEEMGAFEVVADDDYGAEVNINEPKYNKLRNEFSEAVRIGRLIGIYYDKNTGVGYANDKRFHLKINQSDFKIFPELYRNINQPIEKETIAKLLGHTGTGLGSKINELAKSLRTKTNTTKDVIVLNKGTLTLVAKRLDRPPT
jgi:hypothetical protein